MASSRGDDKRYEYRREESDILVAGTPLDLSFKNASSIDDLCNDTATKSRLGKLPEKTDTDRYLTSSMWLSNNHLTSIANLDELAKRFLARPIELRWLDLAYNKLRTIDDDVLQFPNLKILYLHGNDIGDIRSIVKLRGLPKLRSLTLHGNPVEQICSYRRYVLAILPQISNLDFSPVIENERKRPLPTGFYKTIQTDL